VLRRYVMWMGMEYKVRIDRWRKFVFLMKADRAGRKRYQDKRRRRAIGKWFGFCSENARKRYYLGMSAEYYLKTLVTKVFHKYKRATLLEKRRCEREWIRAVKLHACVVYETVFSGWQYYRFACLNEKKANEFARRMTQVRRREGEKARGGEDGRKERKERKERRTRPCTLFTRVPC
jgi:hypothetical protein